MFGKRKSIRSASELQHKAMKKHKRLSVEDCNDDSWSESSSSSLTSVRTVSQEDIRGNFCSEFLINGNDVATLQKKDAKRNYCRNASDKPSSISARSALSTSSISLVEYSDTDSSEDGPSEESSKSLPTCLSATQWHGGSVYAQLNYSGMPNSWLDRSFDASVSRSDSPLGISPRNICNPFGSVDSLAESTTTDSTGSCWSVTCGSSPSLSDAHFTPPCRRQRKCTLRRWNSSGSLEKGRKGLLGVRSGQFLSPVKRAFVRAVPCYDTENLMKLQPGVGVIDTHCHLDFLFRRLGYSETYDMYKEENSQTFPDCYEGCIAVFCDPLTFKQKDMWQKFLETEGVWAAFGCHPHMAQNYNYESEHYLKEAIKHEKVVALGEIGLDYSVRNNCDHDVQKIAFKRQLAICVEENLPLVIHCRDADEDCIAIMKEAVPWDYRIHRHCYTGNWSSARLWLDAFPNLYLGLTALVTFPSAREVHEVAAEIPLERLLLETDAPYFVPRVVQGTEKWSHPGMVIHVAAQIAAIRKDVTVGHVLKVTRQNARSIYGI